MSFKRRILLEILGFRREREPLHPVKSSPFWLFNVLVHSDVVRCALAYVDGDQVDSRDVRVDVLKCI